MVTNTDGYVMDSMSRRKYSVVPIVQGVRTASSLVDADYHSRDSSYRAYEGTSSPVHEIGQEEDSVDGEDVSVLVDYNAVSIYLPGLQLTFSIVITCVVSCSTTLLTHILPMNAVRSLFLTFIMSVVMMHKPLYTSTAEGVDVMFDAIRPGQAVYIGALVTEQLLHSCNSLIDDETSRSSSGLRWCVHQVNVVLMITAGFWQACRPHGQTDNPFMLTTLALSTLALFSPTQEDNMGPLCDVTSLSSVFERSMRAAAFALLYVAHAYAYEPCRHNAGEVLLCATRASAACVWTLCTQRWLLLIAPLQFVTVVAMRLRNKAPETSNLYFPAALANNPNVEAGADYKRNHGFYSS